MSKLSASATAQFVFGNITIVLLLPSSAAFLAKWILDNIFLNNVECSTYLKLGQMHYGHPYFLSAIWSLLAMLLIVFWLRKRFLIFDLAGEKYNYLLVAFLVLASFISVEMLSDMLFPKNKWWAYANYNWFKNDSNDVLIYVFPHLVVGFVQWQLLLVVMRIANVDLELSVAKQLLRRHGWTYPELALLLKKRNPEYTNDHIQTVLSIQMLSTEAEDTAGLYNYSDLRRIEKRLALD